MARITVTVSASSSRTRIAGRHDDGWKVHVSAPAERGRANDAVLALLAGALRIPRNRVRIVAGESARLKVVEVEGLTVDEIATRLVARR